MRVVQQGEIQLYTTKCLKCGSVLEFNSLEENYSFDPDGYMGVCEDWCVECPVCHTNTPTRSVCNYEYFDWRKKV